MRTFLPALHAKQRLAACAPLLAPAFALALVAADAGAHAIVVAAQPAPNAVARPGSVEVKIEFNSRIDRSRSRLSVRRPDGSKAPLVLGPDGPPNVLAGRVDAATAGRWQLDWQVLSLDGHITRGEVPFSVGDPSAP